MEAKKDIPIYRICLTGGPCAGKTTALNELKESLTEKGFKVFVVPEIPTLTMNGGGMIIMDGLNQEKIYKFQALLMKAVINLEDYFYQLAVLSEKPSVILYDRGVMDPKAYMDDTCWQTVLDENDWNPVYLRDKRYDVVIHLVTAADGAEKFYTLENNEARYEDVPTAIKVDQNLQKAWSGHPHLMIIDNSVPGFHNKIQKVKNGVEKFIGIQVSKGYFKKYLVESYEFPKDLLVEKFDVEEVYLKSDDKNKDEYIRKRGQNNAFSYAHTVRVRGEDPENLSVTKNSISAKEYMILFNKRNPDTKPVIKQRQTFIFDKQSFIMETFIDEKITILRVEQSSKDQEIRLPPFFKNCKDVTKDAQYTTLAIASKK